jgi:RNA polymerase sigma-70 factor (ECF subfamily)
MALGRSERTGSHAEGRERLLVEAAQKDPAKFGELYELNFERVYAFVARRVRDRAAAEDLCSEVFHKALAHLPTFDWRGIPFSAWLIRIASNLVSDHWKNSAREIVGDLRETESATTPHECEDSARLFRMVDTLPADQRRVVQMRFAEGKSIREIAQLMGRSEGAIKQLQFRGLENLRLQVSGEHG